MKLERSFLLKNCFFLVSVVGAAQQSPRLPRPRYPQPLGQIRYLTLQCQIGEDLPLVSQEERIRRYTSREFPGVLHFMDIVSAGRMDLRFDEISPPYTIPGTIE